jgi:hypothetical protein
MERTLIRSTPRTVLHTKARIERRDDQIIKVTFLENSTITMRDMIEMAGIFFDLTDNMPMPFLYDAEPGVIITKEAREFGGRASNFLPISSVAVVVQSVAYKLIADFYYKFHKPSKPYKVFKTQDEAIDWLHQLVNVKGIL